jgi:hypothetical protein
MLIIKIAEQPIVRLCISVEECDAMELDRVDWLNTKTNFKNITQLLFVRTDNCGLKTKFLWKQQQQK